jgi:hypothetical protein
LLFLWYFEHQLRLNAFQLPCFVLFSSL